VDAPLVAASHARGLTSMPWVLTGVDDATATIAVRYIAGGGCTTPRGLEIVQNVDHGLLSRAWARPAIQPPAPPTPPRVQDSST
jgi:hypothetical protein